MIIATPGRNGWVASVPLFDGLGQGRRAGDARRRGNGGLSFGNEIEVIGEDVDGDVADDFDDLGIGKSCAMDRAQIGIFDLATLKNDRLGELEQGVGSGVTGGSLAGEIDFGVAQAAFPGADDVGGNAVRSAIDFCDGEGDLAALEGGQAALGQGVLGSAVGAEAGEGLGEDFQEIWGVRGFELQFGQSVLDFGGQAVVGDGAQFCHKRVSFLLSAMCG